jgi:hypothetical protein
MTATRLLGLTGDYALLGIIRSYRWLAGGLLSDRGRAELEEAERLTRWCIANRR